MKKRFTALLLAAALAVGLTGCGSQYENIIFEDNESAVQVEAKLTFLGYKADALNLTAIEDTLHGFMNENPEINISYEGLKGATYWEVLEKRVSTGHMDDLIMVDHDRVQAYSQQGLLADLSGLSTIGDFQEKARNQITESDGSVYFIPTCYSTFGLYCNLDLLEAHDQKVPTDLSELTEVCDYFVSQGVTPIIGNSYSTARSLVIGKGMYEIYQSENIEAEIDKINSGQTDLVELLRPGLELLETMVARGWVDGEEILSTAQTSEDLEEFAKGKRPFMITGTWAAPRVTAMEPGFSFEVDPYPILESGGVVVMDVNTCVAVNASSEYKEEAMEFLEYITQPDAMWSYCESQSCFSPLEGETRTPSDPTIVPQAECFNSGQTVIGSDYTIELPVDSAVNQVCASILKGQDTDIQTAAEELGRLLYEGNEGA